MFHILAIEPVRKCRQNIIGASPLRTQQGFITTSMTARRLMLSSVPNNKLNNEHESFSKIKLIKKPEILRLRAC